MRKEFDFSNAKRASEISHLLRLQANSGKSRITIGLYDLTVKVNKAKAGSRGYQPLFIKAINERKPSHWLHTRYRKGLIKILDDDKRIEYIEQKKSRLYTNPEEQVQAEAYCRLILKYGYLKHPVQNFVTMT